MWACFPSLFSCNGGHIVKRRGPYFRRHLMDEAEEGERDGTWGMRLAWQAARHVGIPPRCGGMNSPPSTGRMPPMVARHAWSSSCGSVVLQTRYSACLVSLLLPSESRPLLQTCGLEVNEWESQVLVLWWLNMIRQWYISSALCQKGLNSVLPYARRALTLWIPTGLRPFWHKAKVS